MDELRRKLENMISLLEMEIYDSEKNIRSEDYFKNGETKEFKINLLEKCQDALKRLANGENVDNSIEFDIEPIPSKVWDLIGTREAETIDVTITKGKKMNRSYKTVPCQIQNKNGKFVDTDVLFKGFLPKFNKEFIVYEEHDTKEFYCTIIETCKNNVIMNDIFEIDNEMNDDIYNMFISIDPKSIDLSHFPSFIRCLGVDHVVKKEEKIDVNKVDLAKEDSKSIKSFKDSDGQYRYKLVMFPSISYLMTLIKKANPDVTITGKIIENSVPGSSKISIIEMSKPIEDINIPSFEMFGHDNSKLDSTSEIRNRLIPISKKDFMHEYHPTYEASLYSVPDRVINCYISDLKQANGENDITINIDKDKKTYQIVCNRPLEELKSVENPCGKDFNYEKQFGYDQQGYLFVQSQKMIEYIIDEKGECHEQRPYYINKIITDIKASSNDKGKDENENKNVDMSNSGKSLENPDNISIITNDVKNQKEDKSVLTDDEIDFIFKEYKKLQQEIQECKQQLEQYEKEKPILNNTEVGVIIHEYEKLKQINTNLEQQIEILQQEIAKLGGENNNLFSITDIVGELNRRADTDKFKDPTSQK